MSSPNNKLEIIQSRIDQYGIRFPVARIVKETGLNKGYVSAVLKGKKPISNNFWQTFDEKFPAKEATNGDGDIKKLPEGSTLDRLMKHLESRADELKADKERLYTIIESYLNSILSNTQANQEQLKILRTQADIVIKQIAHQDEAILRSQLQKSDLVKGGKVKSEK